VGHIRLGRLPSSQRWHDIVALIAQQGSVAEIATAVADATETVLSRHATDPGLVQAFWLLSQLPTAAKSDAFGANLRKLGLDVADTPGLIELATAVSDRISQTIASSDRQSDLSHIARNAAVSSLSHLVGNDLPSLFGADPADVKASVARYGGRDRFSVLTRDFFSRVVTGVLGLYLSRETSNHVGPGKRFSNTADHTKFNTALDRHCRESSRILKEFAGTWYSKKLYGQGEISEANAAGFAAVAFRKMRTELRQRSDRDD
jgi:hypothetical protein